MMPWGSPWTESRWRRPSSPSRPTGMVRGLAPRAQGSWRRSGCRRGPRPRLAATARACRRCSPGRHGTQPARRLRRAARREAMARPPSGYPRRCPRCPAAMGRQRGARPAKTRLGFWTSGTSRAGRGPPARSSATGPRRRSASRRTARMPWSAAAASRAACAAAGQRALPPPRWMARRRSPPHQRRRSQRTRRWRRRRRATATTRRPCT
mmetsp:Transcript_96660/g.262593  ORF Transcript_96660/g.262593 Transcript_96660/m.262593 type:complete len:209 (+) Transcript_96660:485-1111(+)